VVVYEYPVWFWDHWPWMRQERWRRGVWSLRRAGFGLPAWRDLGVASSLNGVLDQKQRALAAYGSQMTSLDGDPAWPTLSDVAGGDFLRCFFSASEYFHVSRPAGATGR
jgi:hypothetical protein